MRLVPIPDLDGAPTRWVSAEHVVSVQPQYLAGAQGTILVGDVKVDGMPLLRVQLGEHFEKVEAEAAFLRFLAGIDVRLIPLSDRNGAPATWVNPEHLVSVEPVYFGGTTGVNVAAEVKVNGMPLQRVALGSDLTRADAEGVFRRFLSVLEGE